MSKFKKILESDNLYYTNLSYDLIDDYLTMVNDPTIQQYIYKESKHFTYEDEKEWIKDRLDKNRISFSIIEKSSDSFVGNIEYLENYEMGVCLTNNFQNRHYGTESINRLIDYGYDVLKLDSIKLSVFSHNERAIHCYRKLGFEIYDVEKDAYVINGNKVDDIKMVLKRK